MPLSDGDRPERSGWLRLALTPGIGPVAARELLERIGAPGTILSLSHAALTAAAGRRIADALAAAPRADAPEVTGALD